MTTIRVTRKKRPDPLQPEIDRRLALKWAAEQRRASGRPIAAVETLRDLAAHLRAHPVTVLIMEARP
jgi:hypothetical protein